MAHTNTTMKKDIYPHHINGGGHHDHEELRQEAMGCGVSSLILFAIVAVLVGIGAFFTGCGRTTEVITTEVPVYVHDTLTTTVIRYDSIHHRDSIYLETFIKGDTVHVNKYVEKWRTKTEMKHDTIIRSVETPVEVERKVEVVKEVPAKITHWQKFRIWVGNITLFLLITAIICLAVFYFSYYRFKRKNS